MESDTIDIITKAFYVYVNSIICIIGIEFNILNLTILKSPILNESPFTYLTALAYSDLLTLFFTLTTTFTRGFVSNTSYVNIELFLKRMERLVFIPTANVFSAMSALVIVALTFERFFFVKFPMHSPIYCTKKNARRIIFALFVFILVFRLPMYFFSDALITTSLNLTNEQNFTLTSSQKVIVIKKYEEYHKYYFLASLTLFEIIPFVLLSILNLSIIILLKYSNRKYEAMNETHAITTKFSGNKTNAEVNTKKSSLRNTKTDSSWSISFNTRNMNSISIRRRVNEFKLTRQIAGLVTLVVMSEICSILTYEKITEFLIGNQFPSYMNKFYKLQVVISNSVVLVVHSINFLILSAFNTRYSRILKEKYYCGYKSSLGHTRRPNRLSYNFHLV